ncbi:hypothetical protein CR513_14763, partial [Mucuna pruriens]
MLDLGPLINIMPTSIYKSLNFGDLEPIGMIIQLANKSVVQPLGVLEDVLVQVNELIFPANFYVLDMKDETSGKGSTLILERPFLMTAKTKIKVHVGTLSMEFIEEHFQLDIDGEDISNFAGDTKVFNCLGSMVNEADCDELSEVHNLSDSEDDITDLADLNQEVELLKLLDQVCKYEDPDGGGSPAHKAIAKKAEFDHPYVVKKEVTKSLATGIIYPISNS